MKKIAARYQQNGLILDLITIFPFEPLLFVFLGTENLKFSSLVLLVKVLRLFNGFRIFNVTQILLFIKRFIKNRKKKLIMNDPRVAEDTDKDHNSIGTIIYVSYILKIFKMVVIMLNICFVLGMFWLCVC